MAQPDVALSAVTVVKSAPPPANAGGEYACDEVRSRRDSGSKRGHWLLRASARAADARAARST